MYARQNELALWREEHRGEGRATPRSTRSLLRRRQLLRYSEWGMRGWSVLGSVLLMGSGSLVWSLLMARWIGSKAYTLVPLH